MIKVGDFLGGLLSGVTGARVQADLEAVRIADFYRNHPILKNFPIPRIRLPKVEMNIPVIVTEFVVEDVEIPTLVKKHLSAINQKLVAVIKSELEKYEVNLKKTEITKLRRELRKKLVEITERDASSVSIDKISEELTQVASNLLSEFPSVKEKISDHELEQLYGIINEQFRLTLINILNIAPMVCISPLTKDVKETGEAQFIATFNLMLEEDALVWTLIDSEGRERNVLLPE